jgi:hypothetical protein
MMPENIKSKKEQLMEKLNVKERKKNPLGKEIEIEMKEVTGEDETGLLVVYIAKEV